MKWRLRVDHEQKPEPCDVARTRDLTPEAPLQKPILFAASTLLMRSEGRARLPGALFHRLVRTCWAGVRGWQDRAAGALGPERQGAAGWNQRAMPPNNSACGHEAAKAIRTRVAVSMTRAAILIRRSRKVVNSAFASGCGLGIASRRVSISQ